MATKTLQQIQDEADRLFGKKPSQQKFEYRRAQQAAAGLEQETKKRGGVAGAYDRNKKLVSAAATVAGFLMGGPAGAGMARGAVQGLDRPGEGGIGFDVKRGIKGFSEGYGAGNVANLGKAGLQKLFTAGAPSAGTAPGMAVTRTSADARGMLAGAGEQGDLVGQAMQSGRAMTPPGLGTTFTPSAAGQAARASVQRIGQGLVEQAGQAAGPMTIRSLLTNPQVLAGGAGAIADVMGQQSQQAIARQQMEQQAQQFQQQFDVSEEERKRRQAEADRLAAMFMARS
jgi:hypothetical protein